MNMVKRQYKIKLKELGIGPQKLVDDMAILWKQEFKKFGLNNDIL